MLLYVGLRSVLKKNSVYIRSVDIAKVVKLLDKKRGKKTPASYIVGASVYVKKSREPIQYSGHIVHVINRRFSIQPFQ